MPDVEQAGVLSVNINEGAVMGEIADDQLCGMKCSTCGIYFDGEHGFPVLCHYCWGEASKRERRGYSRATIPEMGEFEEKLGTHIVTAAEFAAFTPYQKGYAVCMLGARDDQPSVPKEYKPTEAEQAAFDEGQRQAVLDIQDGDE
jgi:hypothetical protein